MKRLASRPAPAASGRPGEASAEQAVPLYFRCSFSETTLHITGAKSGREFETIPFPGEGRDPAVTGSACATPGPRPAPGNGQIFPNFCVITPSRQTGTSEAPGRVSLYFRCSFSRPTLNVTQARPRREFETIPFPGANWRQGVTCLACATPGPRPPPGNGQIIPNFCAITPCTPYWRICGGCRVSLYFRCLNSGWSADRRSDMRRVRACSKHPAPA